MKRTTIIETSIFLYSVLFLYTAVSKLTDFDTFKEQLADSPIVGHSSSLVSILVPGTEFLIVLLLLIPRWRLKGFYLALALMVAFTVYIIVLMSISDKLPCSCGGIIASLSWPQHIVFNSAFILLASWGLLLQRKEIKAVKGYGRLLLKNDPSILSKSL
jgi:hypothetical protein